jgi:hypothetical protein
MVGCLLLMIEVLVLYGSGPRHGMAACNRIWPVKCIRCEGIGNSARKALRVLSLAAVGAVDGPARWGSPPLCYAGAGDKSRRAGSAMAPRPAGRGAAPPKRCSVVAKMT